MELRVDATAKYLRLRSREQKVKQNGTDPSLKFDPTGAS